MTVQDRFLVANLSCPFELMRFQLVYSGTLRSSGNKKKPGDARDIRDELHPQLAELWKVSPTLKRLQRMAVVPKGDRPFPEAVETPFDYHDEPESYPLYRIVSPSWVHLLDPVERNDRVYIPLIRKSLGLACSLDIQFFRRDEPGSLLSDSGDLDGRIATFFDALKIPDAETASRYPSEYDPLCCVLEDDSLIMNFNVSSDRLLTATSEKPSEVLLIVEVKINVLQVGSWNSCLLGD